jgi:DNA segregation ATPase FtsK/SpoIIIE, S-DNA-T family
MSSAHHSTSHYLQEAKGLFLIALSAVLFLSLVSFLEGDEAANWLGLVGYTCAWGMHYALGIGSYLLPLFLIYLGTSYFRTFTFEHLITRSICFFFMLVSFCTLATLVNDLFPSFGKSLTPHIYVHVIPPSSEVPSYYVYNNVGGIPFYYLYRGFTDINLYRLLSPIGTALFSVTTLLISGMILIRLPLSSLLILPKALWTLSLHISSLTKKYLVIAPFYFLSRIIRERFAARMQKKALPPRATTAATFTRPTPRPLPEKRSPSPTPKAVRPPVQEPSTPASYGSYTLPPLSLLSKAKKVDLSSLKKDLKELAKVLEETLLSFGIEASVGEVFCGPTVTLFEVHPAVGVKVQKIKALENDIALNLKAHSVRIIAPIPGKAAIGIEVPNPFPQEVSFRDMLASYLSNSSSYHIPVLLGKNVHGNLITTDLTKMPHCIIAGATGSGKSVCINSIIMTMVMSMRPDELKLLMVDPKKVELTPYSALPHMLAPVITEAHEAYAALNWLVSEMEHRYEILRQMGLRNIKAFNARTINEDFESSLDITIPASMPYIVGIIDELADLMMVSSCDIETPIARIAQMARAVGIHLILATQRPSREVITGIIKANFPTRIAFKVASRINSQIILDDTGAEALLGNGDMLFLPPGSSTCERAQGAYIRDEDINNVIEFISRQAPPQYLITSFNKGHPSKGDDNMTSSGGRGSSSRDNLYDEAYELVRKTGNASTTFLQRKLKVGYARAASLMDMLEEQGIVSPQDGSRPRQVLLNSEEFADDE